MEKIIIDGQTPSKKNGKRIVRAKGRVFVVSSERYLSWEKQAKESMKGMKMLEGPLKLTVDFYHKDRRKHDLDNELASICDLLTEGKVIKDDSCQVLRTVVGNFKGIDKDRPRAEIFLESIAES